MALTLEQLTKRYVGPDGTAVPVIDIPAFSLASGEQVALVGGSGTGKTTLLHLIAGILTPDGGRIVHTPADVEAAAAKLPPEPSGAAQRDVVTGGPIEYASVAVGSASRRPVGVDIATLSEAQRDVFRGRHVGYIFQSHHLLPGFTALENVMLGMTFTGRGGDPAWAKHLLKEVGLSDRLDYKPGKLSVGQQQRVAVARALANRPGLVLADEPTGALDPRTAQQVLELIRKLCDEVKASLLLVSHDPAIVRQLLRNVVLAELNRAAAGYAEAAVPAAGSL